MKTIGLLGGMSWESTILYYQWLNEGVRERLGGLHSAKILMHSFDFSEIEQYQVKGQWQAAGECLAGAAVSLEAAGAEMILICTNLMHKVAPLVSERIDVPLLHIADAAGRAISRQGLATVGLLGARDTMEEDFYRQRLHDGFGIAVLIPEKEEREYVHRVIFEQLCRGQFTAAARTEYLAIINGLQAKGAQGVVLGCTEIPLLIRKEDVALPLFNTTALHVQSALDHAFATDSTAAALIS